MIPLYTITHDMQHGLYRTISQYRRAIVVDSRDNTHLIRDSVPLPAPQPDEFIIRTDAIDINPSDLRMRGPFVVPDGILGIDSAGTVISVGSNVTDLKSGDRVCGPQHLNLVGHPKHVVKACAAGADIICAQGSEAGGHTGEIPTR
jgi:NADPH:quinone reductase-like Zn-dependent oxidoreductase